MKKFLKWILIGVASIIRPVLFGRWWKRWALRISAFVLFPDKGLVLCGWPTLLNINNLEIGMNCSINQGVFIQARNRVVLGNHVTLSPYVLILDAGLESEDVAQGVPGKKHYSAPVVIEDHAWVGAGAIILAGVKIGRHSIVGAGAVVTSDVPPGSVVAGIPARVIKKIQPDPAQPRNEAASRPLGASAASYTGQSSRHENL